MIRSSKNGIVLYHSHPMPTTSFFQPIRGQPISSNNECRDKRTAIRRASGRGRQSLAARLPFLFVMNRCLIKQLVALQIAFLDLLVERF
jgi:hypothetical protein